ncbi:hypothetical protein [Sporosarcina sp. HYO08]|uniref:hypothetical protein n=1 Tax=Sporosarcina sp. HYO08 TaxID=1759557 RepID=UPI000792662D|nr:hypothetical protein [Sporosarcina sp. HYO08]KXH83764.1 hypothetical protein AU377_03075 [Sporosarcina sp. HYO08]
MQTNEMRLRRIQHLAYEIMDEMNRTSEPRQIETLHCVIDNLSRAVGDLTDPFGDYSLNYIEKKIDHAHYLLFKNKRKTSIETTWIPR